MTGDTLGMFVRLIFSLGIVIGLMWGAAHILKRRGFGPTNRRQGPGVQVELLARRTMARNSSIAVVRVGDRAMVVGITDHYITKLGDADLATIDVTDAPATWTAAGGAPADAPALGSGSPWKMMLDQMREKTTRR